MLMGSSFGTAATMGVICMAIGTAMGVSPALMGGAILSGRFFGDRCSPMSSSAALVATLTKTKVFDNVQRMIRTGMAPLMATILVYALLGMGS
ncbi:MAG: sodium:proton antiporter, partial [Atopobiaceae bacterium]|nr:sodium:proton antiporter [Atopobiaceae bacterium]